MYEIRIRLSPFGLSHISSYGCSGTQNLVGQDFLITLFREDFGKLVNAHRKIQRFILKNIVIFHNS